MIDEKAIKGEKNTGFEKRGRLGPFECGNCSYFDERTSSCGEENMMKYSQQPKLRNGRILLAAEDCCEYVDRIGERGLFPEL